MSPEAIFEASIETLLQAAQLADTQREELIRSGVSEHALRAELCRKRVEDFVAAVAELREARLRKWGKP